jgi:hypothetical protein
MAGDGSNKPDAGLGSSSDEYTGWSGNQTHPNSPQGSGGPGRTKSPKPLGSTPDPKKPIAPNSPAGRKDYVGGQLQYASKLPAKLVKFTEPLGEFGVEELNDALYTVFGEESAQVSGSLNPEAEAIISTILNRKTLIDNARKDYNDLLNQNLLENAKKAREQAQNTYEDLTKHPSKYQQEMGEEKYKSAVGTAKNLYDQAMFNLGAAQNKLNAASSAKVRAEAYLSPQDRRQPNFSLSNLVKAPGQYLGYQKGLGDFQGYATMNPKDQERHFKRWETAKDAIRRLATNPGKRKNYIEFRSNKNGSRTLKVTEMRIGGNDFW